MKRMNTPLLCATPLRHSLRRPVAIPSNGFTNVPRPSTRATGRVDLESLYATWMYLLFKASRNTYQPSHPIFTYSTPGLIVLQPAFRAPRCETHHSAQNLPTDWPVSEKLPPLPRPLRRGNSKFPTKILATGTNAHWNIFTKNYKICTVIYLTILNNGTPTQRRHSRPIHKALIT